MKLSDLAQKVGGEFDGDGDVEILGVASIGEASVGDISFIANMKYASQAADTKASAVIVSNDWDGACCSQLLRVENPDAAFAQVAVEFYRPVPSPAPGVHPSAIVAPDVELGEGVVVGALTIIESGVKVGAGTVISAQSYIGHRVTIGENSMIYPQVSLREDVQIGNRSIIHNSSVIGSDGFGYSVNKEGIRTKIPQIGTVVIADDVEVGSNVSIDRARFGKTYIGNGVKIDNLVQIGHNVQIMDHAVVVSQVGLAGSCYIGEKVILAGRSGVVGHVKVGAGSIVGAGSGVVKDVAPGGYVMGFPAVEASKFKRIHATLLVLPKMRSRLKKLEGVIAGFVNLKK